jgi:vancomycin permeability regulator SanA
MFLKTSVVITFLLAEVWEKKDIFKGTVMRNYLLEKGIPDACILVDNKGNNTEASVINTLKIATKKEFKSVIVVSQYFHVTRTKKLFREQNFQQVSSVAPSYFELRDFYSITREFFAYYFG